MPTYALVALLTGEPDPRVWVAAVGELVPETQAAAPSSGLKLSLPPVEASTILPAAPYIALGSGVVAGGECPARPTERYDCEPPNCTCKD